MKAVDVKQRPAVGLIKTSKLDQEEDDISGLQRTAEDKGSLRRIPAPL